MIVPDRLYHGGPPGLSGKLLPRQITGVTGPGTKTQREPGAAGALGDVLHAGDRVYLTTEPKIARWYAAAWALMSGSAYGTVYTAQPTAELELDLDVPRAWAVPSAIITAVYDPVVRASAAPKLMRWAERWRTAEREQWLDGISEADRIAALSAIASRAAALGEAGEPWLEHAGMVLAGSPIH